jgi:hypothetical protein
MRYEWLLGGAASDALDELTQRFRNPAAHLGELPRAAYFECRQLTAGPNGLLWRLERVRSTQSAVLARCVLEKQLGEMVEPFGVRSQPIGVAVVRRGAQPLRYE